MRGDVGLFRLWVGEAAGAYFAFPLLYGENLFRAEAESDQPESAVADCAQLGEDAAGGALGC